MTVKELLLEFGKLQGEVEILRENLTQFHTTCVFNRLELEDRLEKIQQSPAPTPITPNPTAQSRMSVRRPDPIPGVPVEAGKANCRGYNSLGQRVDLVQQALAKR